MNDRAGARTTVLLDYETAARHDDRLELRVWLRLLTCASMIERRVRRRLRGAFGITLPRFDLMAQLDRAPEGLAMGALSRRLMVTNGNVTGLIERMASEGVVERAPAPDDRRVQVVRLTRAGKAAFDAMTPEHGDWIEDMMGKLGREDMADLYAILARLKRSVEHAEKSSAAEEESR
jgi:DNA-binding MarR family transcriptional regulator